MSDADYLQAVGDAVFARIKRLEQRIEEQNVEIQQVRANLGNARAAMEEVQQENRAVLLEHPQPIDLAYAFVRHVSAQRLLDFVRQKTTANAFAAMLSDDHNAEQEKIEESEYAHEEVEQAEAALADCLMKYVEAHPESIPKYPKVKLTDKQRSIMDTIKLGVRLSTTPA